MFKLNEIAQKIYSISPDLSFEDVLKKVKKLKKLHNPPFVKDEKDKRVHLYSESFFDVCLKEVYPDAAVKKEPVEAPKLSKQMLFMEEIRKNSVMSKGKSYVSIYGIKKAFNKIYNKNFSISRAKRVVERSNKTLKPIMLVQGRVASLYYHVGYAVTIVNILMTSGVIDFIKL